jgi:hypothetical protein
VTLFVLSSLEGWPYIMLTVFDAAPDSTGPVYETNIIFGSIYFILFILIGSLFLMNLFVGVIFFQFQSEKEKEKKERFKYINDNQLKWIQMQDLIENASPQFDLTAPPENPARLGIFKIVTSNLFEGFIMLCIILNIVSMGMVYDGMTVEYAAVVSGVNMFFTFVFIIEACLKIFGQGGQYFYSSWNLFDFTIVGFSLVDLAMDLLGAQVISFLKSGPQLARVLRVLRVTRLFKLMKTKQLEGISKIIRTIIFAFPSLMNVLA